MFSRHAFLGMVKGFFDPRARFLPYSFTAPAVRPLVWNRARQKYSQSFQSRPSPQAGESRCRPPSW